MLFKQLFYCFEKLHLIVYCRINCGITGKLLIHFTLGYLDEAKHFDFAFQTKMHISRGSQ